MSVAVEATVGETCAPGLTCRIGLWRLDVLFSKAEKAHLSQILPVFLYSHSEQEITHVMFLEKFLSRLLGAVCGASVGSMEDAASRAVIGREAKSLPRLRHWQQ